MAKANVRFYVVDLRSKYDALATKDPNALYWIEDTLELMKGDKLFGTGAEASEKAAGLLSAKDYAKLQKLIADIRLDNAAPGQIPYMGVNGAVVWSNVALRRDNYFNYKADFVPQNGEICLVDTARDGLRVVCGDGKTKFESLEYVDNFIVKGYFVNEAFYEDKNGTIPIAGVVHKLYIDMATQQMFVFDGEKYIASGGKQIANATSETPGIMKLYDTVGQNIDGTMTQRAITKELNEKFEMDVIPEDEMLIFDHDII